MYSVYQHAEFALRANLKIAYHVVKDYLQEVEDAGDAVIIAKIATKGDPAQYAKMDIS